MNLNWSSLRASAIRLVPGDDLKSKLSALAIENDLHAAAIFSAVGSLSKVSLRLANQPSATEFDGKHEIVSLVGTICKDGVHVHLSASNTQGVTVGGHLMDGSIVYTTAEIVIAELCDLTFARKPCEYSGFKELSIVPRED